MSIIQEALRRKAEEEAAAAGKPAPSVTPPPVRTPYPRPPPRRDGRPRSRLVPWLILLLLIIAAGAIFYGLAASRRPRPRSTSEDAAPSAETSPATGPAAQPVATPAADSSRGDSKDSEADTNPPILSAAASSDVAAAASADKHAEVPGAPLSAPSEGNLENPDVSASAASAAEAVTWPSLDLQGIVLRRPPHPSLVLINGRRLRVGDTIEGARVAEVEEDQVWMELEGRRRALRVGEPWE